MYPADFDQYGEIRRTIQKLSETFAAPGFQAVLRDQADVMAKIGASMPGIERLAAVAKSAQIAGAMAVKEPPTSLQMSRMLMPYIPPPSKPAQARDVAELADQVEQLKSKMEAHSEENMELRLRVAQTYFLVRRIVDYFGLDDPQSEESAGED